MLAGTTTRGTTGARRARSRAALPLLLLACLPLLPLTAHAADEEADSTQAATPVDEGAAASATASVEGVGRRVDDLNEQVQTIQSDLDKLKKFRLSGYIQPRYDISEASSDSVKVSSNPASFTPANLDRFYIRRARLKVTYEHAPWSQAVVQFDGGVDRQVRLIEAYAVLLDPRGSEPKHQLWVGQFLLPFGYEVERSSSLDEFAEKSRAVNVVFPGERDRGLKLMSRWGSRLETTLGVFNGEGTGAPEFPNTDPTRGKDALARVRWVEGWLDVGVSGMIGKALTPLTGPDAITDRTRLGADAQWYYELPRWGGGTVRGEVFFGHLVNPDSVKALIADPTAANPVRLLKSGANPNNLATDYRGWYASWIQNCGPALQLCARYDAWDPNVDVAHDQFERWNFAVCAFYQGLTRFSVIYEIPQTEVPDGRGGYRDPHDNLWTFQLQHTF